MHADASTSYVNKKPAQRAERNGTPEGSGGVSILGGGCPLLRPGGTVVSPLQAER